MAFNLVCNDEAFSADVLNKIAAETTLTIALKIDGSPIGEKITQIMQSVSGEQRMTLVADVSSAVLMFKVERRRGLFDALITDFGPQRFCRGMGGNMRARYHALAAEYESAD
jgi:hypothetical protein